MRSQIARPAWSSRVNEPLPLHSRTLGSFALTTVTFAYLARALESFEPATFDRLVLFLLAILYGLLFLTWMRFLLIWKSFQPFLEQLDRHPIRFVFSDIPGATSISPFFALVAVRDSLRMLAKNASDDLTAEVERFEQQIAGVFAPAMDGTVVLQSNAMPLLNSLKQINAIIVGALNRGCWREGHSERKLAAKDPDTAESICEALREEIIGVQYRDYIQYVVHQQQNLLVFVITGFLLSMAALHCYPFQSPRTVTTFISVNRNSTPIGTAYRSTATFPALRRALRKGTTSSSRGRLSSANSRPRATACSESSMKSSFEIAT